MAERYFVGKGKVLLATINSLGVTTGYEWLGNCPSLVLNTEETRIEHKESWTGNNLTDSIVGTGKSATASFTIDEYTKENLEKFLFGSTTSIASATVTAESLVGYPGKYSPLARMNLTSFTSLTNVGATTTYVNGTDYRVDLAAGLIYVIPGGAITEGLALKANYAAGSSEQISAFTRKPKYYSLMFAGLNQAEDEKPVIVEAYRFRPSPIGSIELITDEFGNLEIEGMLAYDSTRDSTTVDGGFFRIRQTQQA
ncbi:hypothetical protein [Anabaena catenula]|uniref:Uncharacterized protein n=1 Tax=Anabaena catenula FACHB-362 TaxID=2692877 RepID=A0ABR8J7T8_9NOST|nr:hypothetical protein [Anabaena catenula]MBD2694431.1 hypothetical protein [Anabaena catenula FACHB-362]